MVESFVFINVGIAGVQQNHHAANAVEIENNCW